MTEIDHRIEEETDYTVTEILEKLDLLKETYLAAGNTEVILYIVYLQSWVKKQPENANISFRQGQDGVLYPVADYPFQLNL